MLNKAPGIATQGLFHIYTEKNRPRAESGSFFMQSFEFRFRRLQARDGAVQGEFGALDVDVFA